MRMRLLISKLKKTKLRRRHARSQHEPLCQDKPPALTTFTRFRELPGELRNLMYEFYFRDANIILGAKGQPQTKNSTALLFVNKQIHEEAITIMYDHATFRLNMGRQYAPSPNRDSIWAYQNGCKLADCSTIRLSTLHKFNKVQFTLDTPSDEWNLSHWKYAWPSLFTYIGHLKEGQDVQYKVKVGQLGLEAQFPTRYMTYGMRVFCTTSFSTPVNVQVCRSNCAGECKCRAPQARAARAEALARVPARDLEAVCMLMAIITLGREARRLGATLRLESHDGQRKKDITADNVLQLVEQAEGFDKDNDAWIVVSRDSR